MPENPQIPSPEAIETSASDGEEAVPNRPSFTRRDFFVGGKAGALAAGLAGGVAFSQTAPKTVAPKAPTPGRKAAPEVRPLRSRRVSLDIDGKVHDVTVDVRESLWETMNYQLGLSNSNLGCDRAQCGACTVLVDGKPVNGCTVLTARLGRGQKILTVAGIARGPGPEGLHPIQRAFWLEGGFQCGICTRGFVMSTYAFLQTNKKPSNEEIKEALSGNICRCGEYDKILKAVKTAAAEMRGEPVKYTSGLPGIAAAAPTVQTAVTPAVGVSKQFEFVSPLGTIEQFDELADVLRLREGILNVSGTERTITPVWDPAKLDESRVRQILRDLGHPVKP